MAHRDSFTEDYEFEVKKEEGYGEFKGVFGYSVSLPHQCDAWEIIGAEVESQEIPHNDGYPSHPTSKELAINQMELFVKRAQEALEKLKTLD